ncbi:hypothetical protein QJS10_CPB17g00899 [Acorus calamus]|uniref:Uncharacterized protein n=1 Tax=Acorus calamus TaxID=4465 RepID=A0AAV9CUW8_ACOCL|nr:hypothetical protein QJS10_CPB17g00901 [Acorus calamus]KAK1292229.1 hypothetical protein QJS10_CPB17g00899 [Acorus calamus]
MYSPAFYAACTAGGIASCGLTHMSITSLDLVKCLFMLRNFGQGTRGERLLQGMGANSPRIQCPSSSQLFGEASAKKQAAPAESNEANLDLSLGLKSHEGDRETDSKLKEQNEGG